MQYAALACRCAVGLVFVVAVLGKVRGRAAFRAFSTTVPDLVPYVPRTDNRLRPSTDNRLRLGGGERLGARGTRSERVRQGVVGRVGVLVSVVVILAEACVVVLLAVPRTVPAGLVLAAAVLLVFCAGIVRVMRAAARVPCRCFGAAGSPLGGWHLVRNGMLIAVAAAGLACSAFGQGTVRPAGAVLALFGGVFVAIAVVFFEDLIELFTASPGIAGSR